MFKILSHHEKLFIPRSRHFRTSFRRDYVVRSLRISRHVSLEREDARKRLVTRVRRSSHEKKKEVLTRPREFI